MIAVGQVYLWRTCAVVVTEGPAPPRRAGSTLGPEATVDATGRWPSDRQVYTLAVLHDSGAVTWPCERLEETILKWQADGRLVYTPSSAV